MTDLKSELISYVSANGFEYKESDISIVINKVLDVEGNTQSLYEYVKESGVLRVSGKEVKAAGKEVQARDVEEGTEETEVEEGAEAEASETTEGIELSQKEVGVLKRLLKIL